MSTKSPSIIDGIKRFFSKRRIGTADVATSGTGILIPRSGTGGAGGEYGADITDELRTFAITREPVAHRVVFTVAHDIFDNWFELALEGEDNEEKNKEFDKAVQTKLTRLKAKRELTLMSVFERAYGYAILVLGYKDEGKNLEEELVNPTDLIEIKAYGPPQIPKVVTVKDHNDPRYSLPLEYHIKQEGIAAHLHVHYSRVIHFATRRSYQTRRAEWQGLSTLDPVWDDIVTLRNIRWGMGQAMFRWGSGVPDITFTGAEQEEIDDYIESGAFSNISARTYFAHNEDQMIEFKGVAGKALDPMNYYLPIMENISCGTSIPLAILRGVQAGALTGSEVNQQEYYGVISDCQSAYENGIRELINAVRKVYVPEGEGQSKLREGEFEFNWRSGIELPEEKKTQIELLEAQILQIKGQFMTRNEIRKQIDPDLPDLSEEQGGNEILGKSSFMDKQFEKGETFHVNPLKDGSSAVTTLRKRSKKR